MISKSLMDMETKIKSFFFFFVLPEIVRWGSMTVIWMEKESAHRVRFTTWRLNNIQINSTFLSFTRADRWIQRPYSTTGVIYTNASKENLILVLMFGNEKEKQ